MNQKHFVGNILRALKNNCAFSPTLFYYIYQVMVYILCVVKELKIMSCITLGSTIV